MSLKRSRMCSWDVLPAFFAIISPALSNLCSATKLLSHRHVFLAWFVVLNLHGELCKQSIVQHLCVKYSDNDVPENIVLLPSQWCHHDNHTDDGMFAEGTAENARPC